MQKASRFLSVGIALLLAISVMGCALSSTPTPISEVPTVSAYTAPDNAYSFNYPEDWVDLTYLGQYFNISREGWQLDTFLGLYEDEYHSICVKCMRKTYPQPITLEEVREQEKISPPYMRWALVSGKAAIVVEFDYARLDSPMYREIRDIYLISGDTLFRFTMGADGQSYYESFDVAYSTFINSLQVR